MFPTYQKYDNNDGGVYYKPSGGMDLRDYFAAAALTAVCHDWCTSDPKHAEEVARVVYEFADAMLKERDK